MLCCYDDAEIMMSTTHRPGLLLVTKHLQHGACIPDIYNLLRDTTLAVGPGAISGSITTATSTSSKEPNGPDGGEAAAKAFAPAAELSPLAPREAINVEITESSGSDDSDDEACPPNALCIVVSLSLSTSGWQS